jgi:hypothetical protein
MASGFKVITDGGEEATLAVGYDAELQAVSQAPYSDTCAYRYCQDISAYCEADNCKQAIFSSSTSRGPSSSRSCPNLIIFVSSYADFSFDRWGFTIWRTVFTSGSDPTFARALDIINQWVKHECFEQVKQSHTSTGAETQDYKEAQEVWKRYDNVVIEDRTLDGASSEAVRQKFLAWIEQKGVEQNKTSRYRYCILIDEDVLETLGRFPTPPSRKFREKWQVYSLKVIDVEIDGEEDDEYPRGYRCCIMIPPWLLAHIYFFCHNVGADEMRDETEGVPVYSFAS